MKSIYRIIITLIFAASWATSDFDSMAQNSATCIERQEFQKNHFGIKIEGTFQGRQSGIRAEYPMYRTIGIDNDYSRFRDEIKFRAKHDEYGLGAFYVWHPLMKKDKLTWYDGFFVKFALSGLLEVDRGSVKSYKTKDENYFMFDFGINLGYTFTFNKFGLDLYTGVDWRTATKSFKYADRSVYLRYRDQTDAFYFDDVYSWYPRGFRWNVGFGLNYGHFGIFAQFNLPIGYFYREHLRIYPEDTNIQVDHLTKEYKDNKSFTAGIQYRF